MLLQVASALAAGRPASSTSATTGCRPRRPACSGWRWLGNCRRCRQRTRGRARMRRPSRRVAAIEIACRADCKVGRWRVLAGAGAGGGRPGRPRSPHPDCLPRAAVIGTGRFTHHARPCRRDRPGASCASLGRSGQPMPDRCCRSGRAPPSPRPGRAGGSSRLDALRVALARAGR